MSSGKRYTSPRAVSEAITSAARNFHAQNPTQTTSSLVKQEYHRRFLSRIFSRPGDTGWVLKGGTGMLARVATARATNDVDLYCRNTSSTEEAIASLRELAAVDLGDHFRFNYLSHEPSIGGQQQYLKGCSVVFEVLIGSQEKGRLRVDLVTEAVVTDEVTTQQPASALDLPRLTSNPYRIYPVVDHIADKVCATLAFYNGRPSSREKDLVDLVVFAHTEDIEAVKIAKALRIEASVRQLRLPTAFVVPRSWGSAYKRLAASVLQCREQSDVATAMNLMHDYLDPVLDGTAAERTLVWNHEQLTWI